MSCEWLWTLPVAADRCYWSSNRANVATIETFYFRLNKSVTHKHISHTETPVSLPFICWNCSVTHIAYTGLLSNKSHCSVSLSFSSPPYDLKQPKKRSFFSFCLFSISFLHHCPPFVPMTVWMGVLTQCRYDKGGGKAEGGPCEETRGEWVHWGAP